MNKRNKAMGLLITYIISTIPLIYFEVSIFLVICIQYIFYMLVVEPLCNSEN